MGFMQNKWCYLYGAMHLGLFPVWQGFVTKTTKTENTSPQGSQCMPYLKSGTSPSFCFSGRWYGSRRWAPLTMASTTRRCLFMFVRNFIIFLEKSETFRGVTLKAYQNASSWNDTAIVEHNLRLPLQNLFWFRCMVSSNPPKSAPLGSKK